MHEDKVTKSFLKSSDPRTQQKVPFSKLKSCVQLFSVVRGLWEDYQKGAASGGEKKKRPEGYKATVGGAT